MKKGNIAWIWVGLACGVCVLAGCRRGTQDTDKQSAAGKSDAPAPQASSASTPAPAPAPPADNWIEGLLVDEEGNGLAYSTIVYHEVTESGARYAGQNGTDSEGKFKLTNLKAPSYILQGRAIGFIEESMMNPTGKPVKIGTSDVRLVLQRGAVIKGLLLGPDGQPLAKTNVVLRWPQTSTGAKAAADLSEEDGTFEFKGLDDGEYTLLATNSGLKDITGEMKIVVSNRTSPEPVKLQATVAP